MWCLLGISGVAAQQPLSSQQRAWLYRVAMQTKVIKQACGDCFTANEANFTVMDQYRTWIDYNLGERFLTSYPDSLSVRVECLREKSHGLLAELAVKTTLWEMAHHLRRAIDGGMYGQDTLFAQLAQPVFKKLPPKQNKGKKAVNIVGTVMHPSLPSTVKRERLSQLKLTPFEQRALLETWTSTIAIWIERRSRIYFDVLADSLSFYQLKMLAAGDGSATAGLLNEFEPHPFDKSRLGYGVGIGLFTYSYAVKREALVPLPQTALSFDLPYIDSLAVHCSLFGLDSSLKPMIVFTLDDKKSYHLFTGHEALTPNPLDDDGISYLDRIEQTITKRVNNPLDELEKDGGLAYLFDRESHVKDSLESILHSLEADIDTLQLQPDVSQIAIETKRKQINVLLSKISAKERRINDLARKIDAVHQKVDNSRAVVEEMEAMLGPNPQQFVQEGSRYLFADGAMFDLVSQDLVFPKSAKGGRLNVRLIAANMVMGGKSQDEVQMFVNITDAPKTKSPSVVLPRKVRVTDTTLALFYRPDVYVVEGQVDVLGFAIEQMAGVSYVQIAPMITKAQQPAKLPRYLSLQREKQMPLTALGHKRKTEVNLSFKTDTLVVSILSSTDDVPTRLSELHNAQRELLSVGPNNWNNNRLLAMLRAWWLVDYLKEKSLGQVEVLLPNDESRAWWEKIARTLQCVEQ